MIKGFSGGSRGGARGSRPPLILGKKKEMTEGKMADRASKSRPPPPLPPLAQGLDPPLGFTVHEKNCSCNTEFLVVD